MTLPFFRRVSSIRLPFSIAASRQKRNWTGSGPLAFGLSLAGLLAASSLLNRYLSHKAERDHPAEGQFITVRGVKIHYVEKGHGPVVMMLHGNGSALQDFLCSGIVDRLAGKHRVLVFDRPGFGHTRRPKDLNWTPEEQASLFADALTKLGVSEPVVVGHSWGTLVALALAQDPRLACRGLLLASGYYLPTPRLDIMAGSIGAVPFLGPLLCHTVLPLLARASWPAMVRNLFAPRGTETFAAFPKELTFRPSQISASAQETAILNPAVTGLARRSRGFRIPIKFMAGTGDQVVDANHSAKFHRHLPGSTIELVPLQGHMLHHTARARVISAVEEITYPAIAKYNNVEDQGE